MKIERNVLGNVLRRTSALLLRLRVDRRSLKYKKRRETNRENKGKREAVRVGRKVICSQFVLCRIRKPDINFLGLYKLAQALCKFEKDKKSTKSLCQVS